MELRSVINKKGQFKIQQMAFMILAVFMFLALVGVFFLNFKMGSIRQDAQNMLKEQALSSMKVISHMPELSCSQSEDYCLDEDKLRVMAGELSEDYKDFWPVSSIKVYKIFPKPDQIISCPSPDCNYFEVYDDGQEDRREYSSYVSICKRINDDGYFYETCSIGKILLGVKNVE